MNNTLWFGLIVLVIVAGTIQSAALVINFWKGPVPGEIANGYCRANGYQGAINYEFTSKTFFVNCTGTEHCSSQEECMHKYGVMNESTAPPLRGRGL